MRRNKEMIIIPFRSCRKSTTAAVLGAATDEHHNALVAGSDEEYAGASPAPHIVLKMHLHCASCAVKIERVVMDIPGRYMILSAGELLPDPMLPSIYLLIGLVPSVVQGWRSRWTWRRAGLRSPGRRTRRRWRRASRSGRGGPSRSSGTAGGAAPKGGGAPRRRERHVSTN